MNYNRTPQKRQWYPEEDYYHNTPQKNFSAGGYQNTPQKNFPVDGYRNTPLKNQNFSEDDYFRTPQKRPNIPSIAFSRSRPRVQPEDDFDRQLYDELLHALHVSTTEPVAAGYILQTLSKNHLNLHNSSTSNRGNRYEPYARDRPVPLREIPEQDSRQYPASPIKDPLQMTYTRTECLTDFERICPEPCLRFIPSSQGFVNLMSPMHCVFNEKSREWIVADRQQGILFLNQDGFTIRRKLNNFNDPCGVIILNDGDLLGVLDNNGIFVCNTLTGEKRQVFSQSKCRGLAMSTTGDFITIHPWLKRIFIIPQDGRDRISHVYEPLREANSEGHTSSPSFINVSANKLCVVDLAIGSFNLYEYDPETRSIHLIVKQDCCSNGVAHCRLSGGFMDCKGRIIVSNCTERVNMLFGENGQFLQTIPSHETFCRSQYISVNKRGQSLVLDTSSKPHRARLYLLVPDPDIKSNNTPSHALPRPNGNDASFTEESMDATSHQRHALSECKERISHMNMEDGNRQ